MKIRLFPTTVTLLTVLLIGRGSAQQVPGNPGFDRLLCAGLATGLVEILNDDHHGTAVVEIKHGQSGDGSIHTVYYDDANETGDLDCGDAILSIE